MGLEIDPQIGFLLACIVFGLFVLALAVAVFRLNRERNFNNLLDADPCTKPWGHNPPHNGVPRLSEQTEAQARRITREADRAHDHRVKRFVSRETRRKQ